MSGENTVARYLQGKPDRFRGCFRMFTLDKAGNRWKCPPDRKKDSEHAFREKSGLPGGKGGREHAEHFPKRWGMSIPSGMRTDRNSGCTFLCRRVAREKEAGFPEEGSRVHVRIRSRPVSPGARPGAFRRTAEKTVPERFRGRLSGLFCTAVINFPKHPQKSFENLLTKIASMLECGGHLNTLSRVVEGWAR